MSWPPGYGATGGLGRWDGEVYLQEWRVGMERGRVDFFGTAFDAERLAWAMHCALPGLAQVIIDQGVLDEARLYA